MGSLNAFQQFRLDLCGIQPRSNVSERMFVPVQLMLRKHTLELMISVRFSAKGTKETLEKL